MARSPEEVQASLVSTVQNTDPSIDVVKGPVYDFLIAPVGPEVSTLEEQTDRLAKLVTEKFPDAATDDEINAILNCFGLSEAGGKASKGTFQFWTYSQFTTDIIIKRGTMVSTSNATYVYFVSSQRTMYADNIASYYNASTRRYEITAPITAIAIGPQYDMPKTRINKIVTSIEGIDSGQNITETSGGTISETHAHAVERVQAAFMGLNSDAGGSILNDTFKYDPDNVNDVSLVYPKDRSIFVRYTSRPAVDVYVIGERLEDQVQSFQVTDPVGITEVLLDKPPVYGILTVTVNGSANNDWTFVKDTTYTTGGTVYASDKLYFGTAIPNGSSVEIVYQYNSLITGLQEDVFTNTKLFDTDVWAREPFKAPVTIYITAKILSSFDESTASEDIEGEVSYYMDSTRFGQFYYPLTLKTQIESEVSSVAGSGVTITKFTRSDIGTADVQTIELKKNEVLDIANSDINVVVQKA